MNVKWYWNRLRAMSREEILWRIAQKKLELAERKTFGKQHSMVTAGVFDPEKESLRFHEDRLPVAEGSGPAGKAGSVKGRMPGSITLLGGYTYADYKKDWHAGFQTRNRWPLVFSYDLPYKQRDEIGDARTNWELNRHMQFALLAWGYLQSGEAALLTELWELFQDWNANNPFLQGIAWTSVMEVAIRDINWIYTLGFLRRAQSKYANVSGQTETKADAGVEIEAFCKLLQNGIINMTDYIASHFSRYSSANNHVIVEAAAMGMAGLVMDCEIWYETAFSILQYEIGRQNYSDGVNREVSLHYQSFFMEAVGLLALTIKVNKMRIPQSWRNTLCKMSRYVSDCRGAYGETVVFGDDDEGKILDLQGKTWEKKRDHYAYVLQLMGLVLPERYTDTVTDQTLLAIVPENIRRGMTAKPCYKKHRNVCYEEGGVSLLRSRDKRVLIGIDHGELGFGSIAAHGHADALSFQMYLEGEPVFADAGTYIYHIDGESRNWFRSTQNHNTITIDGKNQSEMLGAFLWGRRAQTRLVGHNLETVNAADGRETEICRDDFYVEAEHDGYDPVIHRRKFVSDGTSCLKIYDSLLEVETETDYGLHFLLGNGCTLTEKAFGYYEILTSKGSSLRIRIEAPQAVISIRDAWVSGEYGLRSGTKQIRANGKTSRDVTLVTTIEWEDGNAV